MANKTEIKAEAGKLELFIIREFEAPRELVFRAYTEAELYEKWVGPNDLTMTVEKMEASTGVPIAFCMNATAMFMHFMVFIMKCCRRSGSLVRSSLMACLKKAMS